MVDNVHPSSPSGGPSPVLAQLSRMLLETGPLTDTLQGITELAKDVIPGTRDVSVTMLDGEQARTVVFTGALAKDLDERQYEAGFGPCMDAAVSGETVQVVTAQRDSRYPEFSRLSHEAGVTHVLSVPLPVPGRTVGALNTYVTIDGDLDAGDVETATTFATFAAVAVANGAAAGGVENLDDGLRTALQSRTIVEQAMSILMANHRYSAAEAFESIVQLSKQRERPFRDTARSIVDGVETD